MSAIAVDHSLARPLRAHSLRVGLGLAVLGAGTALAARKVDLGALASTDVVWGWVTLALVLNLGSIAAKAVVWKESLDAIPDSQPVRYRHVVPALFVGFLLNTVLFARLGEVARISMLGRRLSRAGEPRPTTELAGSVLAEQVVLAAALALVAGILALTLGVPALVWQLLLGLLAGIAVLLLVVVVLTRVAPRTRASRAGSARARPGRRAGAPALAPPAGARRRRRQPLVGGPGRRDLGGARGLRHPRRARRRRAPSSWPRRWCSSSPSGRATWASSSSAWPHRWPTCTASTPPRRWRSRWGCS